MSAPPGPGGAPHGDPGGAATPAPGTSAGPPVKVVALGGGHGLAASLAALRHVTTDVTAVVTVADDGGSSGRLRTELGVLPPGDLRMALAALCDDDDRGRMWSEVLNHRFSGGGPLHQHAVGNLLIAALWELCGGHVAGLDALAELVGAHGRVLPMSPDPLDITAVVAGHDPGLPGDVAEVTGQASVAATPGSVLAVRLSPRRPRACPEAVAAVLEADWVVLGPGSWYTSVIPHLLVPDLAEALRETQARRMITLNLAPQPGETAGYTQEAHVEALVAHAPGLRVDVLLADKAAVDDLDTLTRTARALGAAVEVDAVAADHGTAVHDPVRLGTAYARLMARGRMRPWR